MQNIYEIKFRKNRYGRNDEKKVILLPGGVDDWVFTEGDVSFSFDTIALKNIPYINTLEVAIITVDYNVTFVEGLVADVILAH